MKRQFKPWALLCLSVLLAACGSDGDDKTTPTPTARAGVAMAELPMGSTVQLDGSGSTSPDGGTLTYLWTLVGKPANSQAEIADPAAARTTFLADLPGEYEADLRVINAGIAISQSSRVKVTATNTQPVASVAPLMNKLLNSWITLDGSNSVPPTGADAAGLTYAWTVTDQSNNSLTLSNPTAAVTGFNPTVEGIYLARLVVSHEGKDSKPATSVIHVTKTNTRPVAHAGGSNASKDDRLYAGIVSGVIQLDGSQSSDDDGDVLSYQWRIVSWPSAAKAADMILQGENTATPSLTAHVAGAYSLQLTVFDGVSSSLPDFQSSASVIVKKAVGAANEAPRILTVSNQGTNESEPAAASTYAQVYAYDADGDNLTYTATVLEVQIDANDQTGIAMSESILQGRLSLPWGSFDMPGVGRGFNLGALPAGTYKIAFVVNDGTLTDSTEWTLRVRTGAATKPGASITADYQSVLIGTEVTLRGSDASTYRWVLETPAGSSARLQNTNQMRTSFKPDVPGVYRAGLVITDEDGIASNAPLGEGKTWISINAKRSNNTPFARFSAIDTGIRDVENGTQVLLGDIRWDATEGLYRYQLGQELSSSFTPMQRNGSHAADMDCHAMSYCAGDQIRLNIMGYDPDGDAMLYRVTLKQPSGSSFASSYSSNPEGTGSINKELYFPNITVPGDYVFSLQVSDGSSLSEAQSLTVRVEDFPADYTTLKLESNGYRNGTERGTLHLVGTPDGEHFDNQQFLPVRVSCGAEGCASGNVAGEDGTIAGYFAKADQVRRYYKLTAVGQDYTITNLQGSVEKFVNSSYTSVFDGAAQHKPSFEGLTEGQVIRAGESVVFGLWLPQLPGKEAAQANYQYSWRFDVPELVKTNTHADVSGSAFAFTEIVSIKAQD